MTPAVLEKNFTNEGGVFGATRLLKNICGMWLLEECRREWSRQGIATDYAQLCRDAEACAAFRSLIDVDDPLFIRAGEHAGPHPRVVHEERSTGSRDSGAVRAGDFREPGV